MNIIELKKFWNKESTLYEYKEIGDGVQKFVKEVLKSPDIFGLKEGLNSTPFEKRKYEFKSEEIKNIRHADFVIFINGQDIIIPVEVEKYKNIKGGEKQILQYQLDWDKRYGILTDGNTWRFYNNNLFRSFDLMEILNDTEEFLEFWKEYIKPETYYLSFFEPQGQMSLLKKTEKLKVEDNYTVFFDDITKLIAGFKNKLKIEGYFEGLVKKDREKISVEITYAYIVQFILYKTLVDNQFNVFAEEFEITTNKIHSFLKTKSYKEILGLIDRASSKISTNIYRPFSKEQELINSKLSDIYHSLENNLSDISPWLDIFIFIKKYDFVNIRNEIFGYIYENYLKELYEESKKGQYYTDPSVVNFMLNEVGYTPKNLKSRLKADANSISIIDPACGSGTFLYSAVGNLIEAMLNGSKETSKRIEEAVNDSVFGLDIEEFPLYLAEMNILMRMLPMIVNEKYNNPVNKKIKVFKTKDSISEFMDTSIQRGSGQKALAGSLAIDYNSYVRDETDLNEMKASLKFTAEIPRRRFDFVIANPPYISYNEAAKQHMLVFDLIKKGKIKLNNIYGVNLHSTPDRTKRYRPNPNIYAFFIALGIALLKERGKLCYIIPQTILTAGDLDTIRYHLAKFTTIEKIVTFSGKMFIGRGLKQDKPIPTSSLIFILNPCAPEQNHFVQIVNYTDPNDTVKECLENISEDKKVTKSVVLQSDLLKAAMNWNFIKYDRAILNFYQIYNKNSEDISVYYDHNRAEHVFKSRFYFDSGYDIDERHLLQAAPSGDFYKYPKLSTNTWIITEARGFWPNIRKGKSPNVIKLRQANQGYGLLDSPYKVIWSYMNPDKFFFTSEPVIWPRNQICGIGSKNEEEIMYLFALLNSSLTNTILNLNLKTENEKSFQISTSSIKEYVRVPKITENNLAIKKEIIKSAKMLIKLEDAKLFEFVDFSNLIVQRFNKVSVTGNKLILSNGKNTFECKIKKDQELVLGALKILSDGNITLPQLKYLPVIDVSRQKSIKEYIDDLIFALYFEIQPKSLNPQVVHEACNKSKFYYVLSI